MPPSGFNRRAINGLLQFVQATYENANKEIGSFADEQELLEEKIYEMDERVRVAGRQIGLSHEAVRGLATFVTENYRDLIKEIHAGKKPMGEAMAREIEDIRSYLAAFDIHHREYARR